MAHSILYHHHQSQTGPWGWRVVRGRDPERQANRHRHRDQPPPAPICADAVRWGPQGALAPPVGWGGVRQARRLHSLPVTERKVAGEAASSSHGTTNHRVCLVGFFGGFPAVGVQR